MTEELYWIYAFNLIVNSFLAFLTIAILIQLLFFVFRIEQPRFKALMLSLPLMKLGLDPFLYKFQNWALMFQNNPLTVEADSRVLSAMISYSTSIADLFPLTTAIRFSLANGQTFSLADMAALTLPPLVLKGLIVIVAAVSVALSANYILRLSISLRALSEIKRHTNTCKRALQNQKLIGKMKVVHLVTSPGVDMPCAFGIFRKWICFPTKLIDKLSQEEFEAIIAHEVSHLLWYDGVVRAFCLFLANLFWWVPTRWWLTRMECAQEKACDTNISRFNIDRLDLASALLHTLKIETGATAPPMMITNFSRENLTGQRLKLLLEPSFGERGKFSWLQAAIAGSIALSLLCGRFWIF